MDKVTISWSTNAVFNKAKELGISINNDQMQLKKKPQLVKEINDKIAKSTTKDTAITHSRYEILASLSLMTLDEALKYQKENSISDEEIKSYIFTVTTEYISNLSPVEQLIHLKQARYLLVTTGLSVGQIKSEIFDTKHNIIEYLTNHDLSIADPDSADDIPPDQLYNIIYKFHLEQWDVVKRGAYTNINNFYADNIGYYILPTR